MITRITSWARTLRVPTTAQLAQMSDDEAVAAYYTCKRRRGIAAALADLERREAGHQAARRAAERLGRQRAKRAARREEYDLHVHAAWLAAESDCNGYLLSKAGLAAGAEPATLWSMPDARAQRLASEELRGWWRLHGRVTFAQWQRKTREQRPETAAA